MRRPTTPAQEYAWWKAVLAGDPVTYHEDEIHSGWFKRRMVYRGPYIPASIWIHRDIDPDTGELLSDETFACEVGGEMRDALEEWVFLAKRPITKQEYEQLRADAV